MTFLGIIEGQAIVFKNLIDSSYFNMYKFCTDKIYFIRELYLESESENATERKYITVMDDNGSIAWFSVDELKASIYTLFDLI